VGLHYGLGVSLVEQQVYLQLRQSKPVNLFFVERYTTLGIWRVLSVVLQCIGSEIDLLR
jgi:hypothetical protein